MSERHWLLAIDQGTSNSRAIIFDRAGNLLAQHQLPLSQQYPHDFQQNARFEYDQC